MRLKPRQKIDRSTIPYTGEPARPGCRLFFTVSGRGAFPQDMLRYDECVAGVESPRAPLGDVREIPILSAKSCTPERWRSFGWSVHDDIVERAAPVSVSVDA